MTEGSAGRFAHSDDDLRLMARVARMYHERGMRQAQIADALHLSQARVSRLLKRATEVGIVRTIVALPPGVYTDLEEQIEREYGLEQAIVVDGGDSNDDPTLSLGSAAAEYLETTLTGGERIGISSWSATLLAAVESMRRSRVPVAETIVQVVGGLGDPRVQMQASRLLGLFASCTGAEPVFMPTPGMLGAAASRDSLMSDPTVAAVVDLWPELTMALVGIGSVDQSPLLRESGNALAQEDQARLRDAGAVGDICLRFFDADGDAVRTSIDERVVGISLEQLRSIPRRVGVAGGADKHAAIRGSLLGGWVNVLITDLAEARRLVADVPVIAVS